MKISSLDELPKFSKWPKRLLGLEPWEPGEKTEERIAALLERFRQNPGARLEDVVQWASGTAETTLASVDQHIVEMTAEEAQDAYIAFIENALVPHLPASALVEIGADYAGVILALSRKVSFQDIPYLAAQSTESGTELARRIAEAEGVRLETGKVDVRAGSVTDLNIPEGAIVYTAYAAHHIEPLTDDFVNGLIALKPKAVVHIEPVYEHCDPQTLLGLLRQSYIQANGYNRNLSTILHDHEARGSLEIIQESVPGFGPNPLLAASVIAWTPR